MLQAACRSNDWGVLSAAFQFPLLLHKNFTQAHFSFYLYKINYFCKDRSSLSRSLLIPFLYDQILSFPFSLIQFIYRPTVVSYPSFHFIFVNFTSTSIVLKIVDHLWPSNFIVYNSFQLLLCFIILSHRHHICLLCRVDIRLPDLFLFIMKFEFRILLSFFWTYNYCTRTELIN